MGDKHHTIRNKLITRGWIILALIILLIIASQIVVGILKKTSNEFFIEYNEMNAIQEFKLSIYQILLQSNKYTLIDNPDDQTFFKILLHQAHDKLSECNNIITESHDSKILNEFPLKLNNIEKLSNELFNNKYDNINGRNILLRKMNNEITECLNQIDIVLIEIKFETVKYYNTNKTVFNHSTLAILFLGLVIVVFFIVFGLKFINNLTKPIHDFVATTQRIIKGERSIKVKVDTSDEFSTLADSFNLMLDSLESTTVSKTYLDNILMNMFDSLIVTDRSLFIRSINDSASALINHPKKWFEGKSLEVLFGENVLNFPVEGNFDLWKSKIQNLNYFVHSSGRRIPALISCAVLRNESGQGDGLIIVGHDLTIKKEIEKKLENSRKQRQIDINEAQEEERMRIATDLHDGLGQMLTAVSYSTQEFKNIETLSSKEKENLLITIQNQIDIAIKESKNLAHNLIPIVLKDFGLDVAINNLIDKANDMYDIHFSFNAFDYDERINVKLEKALYRICQESLNNIVKHSKAKNVNYQIFKQNNLIILVIDDDGIGFNIKIYEETSNKGIGLISMRERVQSFGGSISIDSQVGIGTEILIEIPF
jgi:signal transduction histidine kinase